MRGISLTSSEEVKEGSAVRESLRLRAAVVRRYVLATTLPEAVEAALKITLPFGSRSSKRQPPRRPLHLHARPIFRVPTYWRK